MGLTLDKSIQSKRDIEEAFVYIAEDNLDVAVRFLVAVEDTLEMLLSQPFAGRIYLPESKQLGGVRVWRVKGFEDYLLFYSTLADSDQLILLRLLSRYRDLSLIFD